MKKIYFVIGLFLLLSSNSVQSNEPVMSEYLEIIKEDFLTKYKNLSVDPSGIENYDPVTGVVTFNNVDVSVPGNFDIPVEIRRRWSSDREESTGDFGAVKTPILEYPINYGSWALDVPYIRGYYLKLWNGGSYNGDGWHNGKICEGGNLPATVSYARDGQSYSVSADKFWDGMLLHIPSVTTEKFLDGVFLESNSKYVTKSNYRLKECFLRSDGKGDGARVEGPDGKIYTFGEYKDYYVKDENAGSQKIRGMLFISKVEDRYGNFVDYKWVAGDLKEIASSDGRTIKLFYKTNSDGYSRLDYVVSNGIRTSYEYSGNNLYRVHLPGGRNWEYNASHRGHNTKGFFPVVVEATANKHFAGNCTKSDFADDSYRLSVKLPSGAIASYELKQTYHGRTNTFSGVRGLNGGYVREWIGRVDEYVFTSLNCTVYASLVEKVVSHPGGRSESWKYRYSENKGSYAFEGNPNTKSADGLANYANNNIPGSEYFIYSGTLPDTVLNSRDYKTTTVQNDGRLVKYYIDRRFHSFTESSIVAVDTLDSETNTLLKRVENTYIQGLRVGRDWGWSTTNSRHETFINRIKNEYRENLVNVKTKMYFPDGVDTYNTSYSEFDSFGYYKIKHESNSLNWIDKYTKYTYVHAALHWILGLQSSISVSSTGVESDYTEVRSTSYHDGSTTQQYYGLYHPYEVKEYGVWTQRFKEYFPDGNIQKVEFNAPLSTSGAQVGGYRYIEFSDYYRGSPRLLTYPARYDATATVSASRDLDYFGQVTLISDLNDNVRTFTYDNAGRLKAVNNGLLSGDWADTVISWSKDGNGAWSRESFLCDLDASTNSCIEASEIASSTVFYDGLMRVIQEQNTDFISGVNRYKNYTYDSSGRTLFQSYDSESEVELQGIHNVFDALGRNLSTRVDGMGTATTAYISGNRVVQEDGNRNPTTTQYRAFGQPEHEIVHRIESPESVTTTIQNNIFGNITRIEQTGFASDVGRDVTAIEYRYYDNQQRLCLLKRADVGDRGYTRNALGEVTYLIEGKIQGTECVSGGAGAHPHYRYDNLGGLHKKLYWNKANDVEFVRDPLGNVLELNNGVANRNYQYFGNGKVKNESLSVDGLAFNVSYEYDKHGPLKRVGYPDYLYVRYINNGFGEATSAFRSGEGRFGSYVYAVNGNYYPNGALASFKYGNGFTFSQSLNDARIPESIKDTSPNGVPAQWTSFTYDANMNVKSILDHVNAGFSLTYLDYDGLDRLTTAEGGAGIGSSNIEYDGLGNILSYKTKNSTLSYSYNRSLNRLDSVSGVGSESKTYPKFNYDSRGNVTGNGHRGFTYDLAGLMVNSGGYSYTYDGKGNRVKQVDSKGTQYFFYGHDGKLLYRRPATFTGYQGTFNVYLGDRLLARDGLPDGGKKQHYRPFGESIEGAYEGVGYTGHDYDQDLGLNYMKARYYDPVLGRFYSNDPVGYSNTNPVMSFNRYMYVNNNPYKYNDPNGEFLNFAAKFVADVALGVAIQVATGQDIDVTAAVVDSATGILNPAKTVAKVAKLTKALGKGKCCFVAGTQVLTETGFKNIEDVKLGEKLWAKNTDTGEQDWKPVTKIFVEADRGIYEIKLIGSDGFEQKIQTTDDHPFYVVGDGWKTTIELAVGDYIETDGDGAMMVTSVVDEKRKDLTYNFTVADFHTYYITEHRVLVHNCNNKIVTTEVTRTKAGGPRVTQTFEDGKVKNITDDRVKEYVPNNHPKAPEGAAQKVKFEDSQPGSKGYKRDPTPEEIKTLDEHR